MRLEYHPGAVRDMQAIINYYEGESPTAKDRFLAEFQIAIEGIKANPARTILWTPAVVAAI